MDDLSFMTQTQNLAQHNLLEQKTKAMLNKVENTQKPSFEYELNQANQVHDPDYQDMIQRRKVKEVAQDFEAQFLGQMLKPMFENINISEPFGGGHAEKMWQSMLVQEYGKAIAKRGGIGLADDIERQLLRTIEGQ